MKKLVDEEQHIRQVMRDNAEDVDDLRSAWQERDDPAERNIRDVEWEQFGSLQDQLDKILESKNKLGDGTYGICEDCGGAISPKRLEAVISARLCLSCQQKTESGAGT